MPEQCVVPGCKSNLKKSIETEGYTTLFLFPQKGPRRDEWIRAINRPNWTPSRRSYVCVKHFNSDDLGTVDKYKDKDGKLCKYTRDKPVLNRNAVPRIFDQTDQSWIISTEARRLVRELWLQDQTLRPSEVLTAVIATAPAPVVEYIQQHKQNVQKLVINWRHRKLNLAVVEESEDPAGANKSAEKPTPKKKKKEEAAIAAAAAATSYGLNQYVPTSSIPPECGPSTSASSSEEIFIKEERIEEELMLEDYGIPSEVQEFQPIELVEVAVNVEESGEGLAPSSSLVTDTEGPFETIICGSSSIQIKQEIFEDESGTFNNPLDIDQTSAWSGQTAEESQALPPRTRHSQVASNSSNVSPKTSTQTQSVRKSSKRASNVKIKPQKSLKTNPALGIVRCQICVNEIFSSPSDMVEHCILKHHGASSNFLPVDDHSIGKRLEGVIAQKLNYPILQDAGCATANAPDFSVATTPGFGSTFPLVSSTATTAELSAANLHKPSSENASNQPPLKWFPPYISTCDVFDGVFVSLRNVPLQSRKSAKDKILELVNFISIGNVDPSTVSFSVIDK